MSRLRLEYLLHVLDDTFYSHQEIAPNYRLYRQGDRTPHLIPSMHPREAD